MMRCETDLIKRYKKDNSSWYSVDFQHTGNGYPDCYFFKGFRGIDFESKFVEFKFTPREDLTPKLSMFRPIQISTIRWLLQQGVFVSVVVGNDSEYKETSNEELLAIISGDTDDRARNMPQIRKGNRQRK